MSGATVSSVPNRNAKKQGEEADRLIREAAGSGDDDQAQAEATAAAEAEAKKKAELEASDKAKQNLDPDNKSPEAGAEPTLADNDWKARFKGLQAVYDRDVPKLRGELQTAYTSIDGLQGQIDELKALISKPAELIDEPVELDLSDEEREQYGPGLIAMMEKIALSNGSELAKQVIDLQQELSEVKIGQKQMVEHSAVSDEQKFFSTLTAEIENWGEINDSADFHQFLEEEVAYTGHNRRHFLDTARERLDVGKVIRIFKDFTSVAPQGSSLDSELPKSDLDVPEELITPKNSGSGIPPAEEQKYYSTAEVNKFYHDKSTGKYKGKEEEAKILEKDIFAAGREGRILSDKAYERSMKFTDKELS